MDKMFVWKTIQRSGRIYTPDKHLKDQHDQQYIITFMK